MPDVGEMQLDKALQELSSDIYCSSLQLGPEHVDTAPGYYLMANIFYAQRKVRSHCSHVFRTLSGHVHGADI